MTNEQLQQTVLRILRQPGISQIGFQIGRLLVTGERFAAVARAVEEGKIECRIMDGTEGSGTDLAPGMMIEAQYKSDRDAILFPDADYGTRDGGEERTIVHECTHAIFDLYSPGKKIQTQAIDDESAAVLSEAFYIRLCKKTIGGFLMEPDGPRPPALRLVDSVASKKTGGLINFTADQLEDVRRGVGVNWNFQKYIGSDGLPTDATGAKYGYNGVKNCTAKWLGSK